MRRLAMLLLCAVAFAGLNADAAAATKKIVTKAKPVTKAPPPAARTGSSGFYIGINGGYGWGRATFSSPASSTSVNTSGGMVGPTFGYNAQSGALVYGFETDIDAVWMKRTNWNVAPCFGCETGLTYFGTLRGRLGYAVGQALPYITGGLAYGGVKTEFAGISNTDTRAGWTAGAGVEFAVAGAWSVKTEYLYFDLGSATCPIATCGAAIGVKVNGNLVRVGTNFRF